MTKAPPGRDFITIGLEEIEAQDRSRVQTARIHDQTERIHEQSARIRDQAARIQLISWITLGVLLLLLGLVVILLGRDQPLAGGSSSTIDIRVTEIERNIKEIHEAAAAKMSIGQWVSGDFGSAGHGCALGASGADPCVLNEVGEPGSGESRALQILNDAANGPILVVVTGGHDRTPLKADFQRRVGSNTQLAQLRSDAVREHLLSKITDEERKKSVWIITTPRGATTLDRAEASDRTVTVSILRILAS